MYTKKQTSLTIKKRPNSSTKFFNLSLPYKTSSKISETPAAASAFGNQAITVSHQQDDRMLTSQIKKLIKANQSLLLTSRIHYFYDPLPWLQVIIPSVAPDAKINKFYEEMRELFSSSSVVRSLGYYKLAFDRRSLMLGERKSQGTYTEDVLTRLFHESLELTRQAYLASLINKGAHVIQDAMIGATHTVKYHSGYSALTISYQDIDVDAFESFYHLLNQMQRLSNGKVGFELLAHDTEFSGQIRIFTTHTALLNRIAALFTSVNTQSDIRSNTKEKASNTNLYLKHVHPSPSVLLCSMQAKSFQNEVVEGNKIQEEHAAFTDSSGKSNKSDPGKEILQISKVTIPQSTR